MGLKGTLSLLGLKVFNTLYTPYKIIKKNSTLKYASLAGIFAFLLVMFLLPSSSSDNLSPFGVLGVTPEMSKKEISRVYRKLSLQFHHDKNPGDEAAKAKYIQIQKAYEM
jgi:preprotein translocase subunit Sec63